MLETYGNPRQAKRRGNTKNPAKADFFADMNNHATAEYRKPTRRHIIEMEAGAGERARVVVWEAVVKRCGTVDYYPEPDDNTGNTYLWDAVGSTGWVDPDDAEDAFSELADGDLTGVLEWCGANPYNGPRTPHEEREGDL